MRKKVAIKRAATKTPKALYHDAKNEALKCLVKAFSGSEDIPAHVTEAAINILTVELVTY